MVRIIPLEIILAWPPANYDGPQTRGDGLIVLTCVLVATVTLFVMLRLYVRMFLLKWVGVDDVFMILAYISACGMATCVIVGFKHDGWDRHIWDVPWDKFEEALYLAWWAKIVFSCAACFTRLSLLCFYWHLTRESSKRLYRVVIILTTVISILVGLVLVFLTVFQCLPVRASWTFPPIPTQRCLDDGWSTLFCGVANNVADILVVVLPIPLIAKLQIPLRQRAGAIVLISLGLVVCVAGGARTYFTWYALIKTYDYTWNGFGIYMSAMIEVALGVICACAPALRVFVVKAIQPRIAKLAKLMSKSKKSDLTSFSLDKDDGNSTIDSRSRLRSHEEMQMAAMYPYHPSQVPSPVEDQEATDTPLSLNNTETLAPPPTDAQIIRANMRRANIIHFQPRRQSHKKHRRRHSTYETMPPLDELSANFDVSGATRRRSLTPRVAQFPGHPRPHTVDQLGTRHRRHSSVIDLDRTDFLDSPTIMERAATSVASSSIGTIPIFYPSPESSPPNTRLRSDTLRIPDRTLRTFRGLLFDFDAHEAAQGRMTSWPAANTRGADKRPLGPGFFDETSIDTRAVSPVTRYVRQQHSVLQSAIALDQERAKLSQERRGI